MSQEICRTRVHFPAIQAPKPLQLCRVVAPRMQSTHPQLLAQNKTRYVFVTAVVVEAKGSVQILFLKEHTKPALQCLLLRFVRIVNHQCVLYTHVSR